MGVTRAKCACNLQQFFSRDKLHESAKAPWGAVCQLQPPEISKKIYFWALPFFWLRITPNHPCFIIHEKWRHVLFVFRIVRYTFSCKSEILILAGDLLLFNHEIKYSLQKFVLFHFLLVFNISKGVRRHSDIRLPSANFLVYLDFFYSTALVLNEI